MRVIKFQAQTIEEIIAQIIQEDFFGQQVENIYINRDMSRELLYEVGMSVEEINMIDPIGWLERATKLARDNSFKDWEFDILFLFARISSDDGKVSISMSELSEKIGQELRKVRETMEKLDQLKIIDLYEGLAIRNAFKTEFNLLEKVGI